MFGVKNVEKFLKDHPDVFPEDEVERIVRRATSMAGSDGELLGAHIGPIFEGYSDAASVFVRAIEHDPAHVLIAAKAILDMRGDALPVSYLLVLEGDPSPEQVALKDALEALGVRVIEVVGF